MVIRSLAVIAALAPAFPAMAFQTSQTIATNALQDQSAYAERMRREMLDLPTGAAVAVDPDQSPRRQRRATAAAALINGGDCPGALALAEREHDSRLAARINLVCAAEPARAPQGAD